MKAFIITVIGLILVGLLLGLAPAHAGTTSDPYTGTSIQINGTFGATTVFEAANYDKGIEGVAFHNPNPGDCTVAKCSCVQVYRFNELPICGGVNPFLTYTDNGLWAIYTIDILTTGNYTVELLVAIGDAVCCADASYHVRIDEQRYPATGSYPLGPATTAGWNSFEWRGKSELIPLVPGTHKLLIAVDQHWFNWDSIRVRYAGGIVWDWVWTPVWRVAP